MTKVEQLTDVARGLTSQQLDGLMVWHSAQDREADELR